MFWCRWNTQTKRCMYMVNNPWIRRLQDQNQCIEKRNSKKIWCYTQPYETYYHKTCHKLVACGFDQKMRRLLRWFVVGRDDASHFVLRIASRHSLKCNCQKFEKKSLARGGIRTSYLFCADGHDDDDERIKGCGDQAKRLTVHLLE